MTNFMHEILPITFCCYQGLDSGCCWAMFSWHSHKVIYSTDTFEERTHQNDWECTQPSQSKEKSSFLSQQCTLFCHYGCLSHGNHLRPVGFSLWPLNLSADLRRPALPRKPLSCNDRHVFLLFSPSSLDCELYCHLKHLNIRLCSLTPIDLDRFPHSFDHLWTVAASKYHQRLFCS